MTELETLVKEWQEAGKEWFAWAKHPDFLNFKTDEAEQRRNAIITRMANAEAALRAFRME